MNEDPASLALRFESLGGGSRHADQLGWSFGCEFGAFQRQSRGETVGLLRWASIHVSELIRALNEDFAGIGETGNLRLREHGGWDWAFIEETYKIRVDHTGLRKTDVTEAAALPKLASVLRLLKRKLLEDLAEGEKVFVYRVLDDTLDAETLQALSNAIKRHGPGYLLYVALATEDKPAFTVEWTHPNLLTGYIDAFAPQNHKLIYNTQGWSRICRECLRMIATVQSGNVQAVGTPVSQFVNPKKS